MAGGSVDAVTVGQAFHWSDGPRAVAELHRVLRPAWRVGLLWNVRDESVPWMAAVTAILDRHAGDAPGTATAAGGRLRRRRRVRALQVRRFRHRHELERAALADRFASISFVAALPDPTRARVLAEIEEVAAAEPSLAGPGPVAVPYRTDLFWTERLTPRRDDADHDVAELGPRLDVPVGLDDLVQPVAAVDQRPERPRLEQPPEVAGRLRVLPGMGNLTRRPRKAGVTRARNGFWDSGPRSVER